MLTQAASLFVTTLRAMLVGLAPRTAGDQHHDVCTRVRSDLPILLDKGSVPFRMQLDFTEFRVQRRLAVVNFGITLTNPRILLEWLGSAETA